jgi:regulator of sigma E protease
MDLARLAVTILLFIVVLGGIVLIHEIGHFVAARLAKVRVLEFGIGFPPRAKVLRTLPPDPGLVARWQQLRARDLASARAAGDAARIAEIEASPAPVGMQYTLNWLPIGGFVKMDGEDGDVADDRSFSAKPLRVRLAILLAGVAMNVALAAVIFIAIAALAAPRVGADIAAVQPGSPAEQAGLAVGDVIVAVDGQRFDAYSPDVPTVLREHAGQIVTVSIRHADGSTADVAVTLRNASEAATNGALGISARGIGLEGYATHPLGEAIVAGVGELVRWGGLIVGGLGTVFGGFVTHPTTPPEAAGPIGIAGQLSDVFFSSGWITTLYVAGVLSINLAVVNILPFPPLDGGRMLVLILKRLFGRRISLRAEQLTYLVGFVFLIGFVLWISGFDIARQLGASQ